MNGNRGFSLTEIVIALGLMGGVGLMASKLITDSKVGEKSRSITSDMEDLKSMVKRALRTKEACMMNFSGKSAISSSHALLQEMVKGNPRDMLQVNRPFGANRLLVETVALQDNPGMDDGVNVVPGTKGTTNLVITLKRPGAMKSQAPIRTRIKMSVETDSAGMIENCFSVFTGEDLMWVRSDSTPDDIYYPDGYVGVGTENPQDPLHVAGSIIATTTGGDRITLGGAPAQFQIILSADKVFELWNDVTNAHADLSAGTIRADYVVLSTVAGGCFFSNEGAITYDPGSGKVRVCEMGVWKAKRYVTWCTPPSEIHKGHDEWMRFHQTTQFRPQGYKCDNAQIRKKSHAKIRSDVAAPYTRVKFDDTSRPCSNNTNCQDFNPEHQ